MSPNVLLCSSLPLHSLYEQQRRKKKQWTSPWIFKQKHSTLLLALRCSKRKKAARTDVMMLFRSLQRWHTYNPHTFNVSSCLLFNVVLLFIKQKKYIFPSSRIPIINSTSWSEHRPSASCTYVCCVCVLKYAWIYGHTDAFETQTCVNVHLSALFTTYILLHRAHTHGWKASHKIDLCHFLIHFFSTRRRDKKKHTQTDTK